jgi:hypothetical protein
MTADLSLILIERAAFRLAVNPNRALYPPAKGPVKGSAEYWTIL